MFVAPEVFAQHLLESCDDGQRAPGLASQESADGGLVDPAEFFDLLEALSPLACLRRLMSS